MTFNQTQLDALKAPLGRSNVKTRQQAGRAMSYIEGWHAIAEANRIFGHGMWDRETVELRQLGEPILGKDKYGNDQWRVAYSAKVRITVRTTEGLAIIVREGCGYGSGIDKDLGSAHESALKEAETDAMKRALMTFGNPFGLALYDKEQAEVVDDTKPAAPPPKAAPPTQSASKPNGAAPKKTPYQWALEARSAIEGMKTADDLKAWEHVNKNALLKLEEVEPIERAELSRDIKNAYARLNKVSA